jgi:hypothetical protein
MIDRTLSELIHDVHTLNNGGVTSLKTSSPGHSSAFGDDAIDYFERGLFFFFF